MPFESVHIVAGRYCADGNMSAQGVIVVEVELVPVMVVAVAVVLEVAVMLIAMLTRVLLGS
jgi:hypothetical protein